MKAVFLDYGGSKSETPDRIFSRLERTLDYNGFEALRNPSRRPTENYLLIRWGTPRSTEFDDGADSMLNMASAITFNLNKRNAHQRMLEAGVSCPVFWTTYSEAQRRARQLGCDILRRRLRHHQGTDILRLRPSDPLPRARRSGYYVQLLNKTAEFRLHMFDGECIGIAEKRPKQGERQNQLIWNFENGWDLVYTAREDREDSIPNYSKMVAESHKALEAIGLDFGAVDLIMVNDKPYVLEVNTAPKLYQTKRYSKAMLKWISEQTGKRLRDPPRDDDEE